MTELSRFYANLVRRHSTVSGVLAAVAMTILAAAIARGHVGQAVAYLSAVSVGVIAIDVVSLLDRQARTRTTPVRHPPLESLMLFACWAIAIAWLTGRFVFDYRPASAPLRLLWVTCGLGSVFSVMPALFLLARRYWPTDLGLRFSGIVTALPVLVVFAAIALIFSRGSMTWAEIRQGNTTMGIVLMTLSAAVPEEFFRFVWQTRLAAWARNPAVGWMIATVAWAMLHGPKDFSESRSLTTAAVDVVNIVPLGLLWGYLSHRTSSFLPSLLLHGMNVWGLQNL